MGGRCSRRLVGDLLQGLQIYLVYEFRTIKEIPPSEHCLPGRANSTFEGGQCAGCSEVAGCPRGLPTSQKKKKKIKNFFFKKKVLYYIIEKNTTCNH